MGRYWFALAFLFVSAEALAGLKIAAYNIRNFDYDSRDDVSTNVGELKETLRRTRADLISIEEIVNTSRFKTFIEEHFEDYDLILSECGGAGKQRLGFLYKKSVLENKWHKEESRVSNGGSCNSGLRPAMIAGFRVKQTGLTFTAIAVHLKAGGRQGNADVRYRQYQILTEVIREQKRAGETDIVVLGDFNTTDFVLRNQNYGRFVDFLELNDMVSFSTELDCTSFWWGNVDDGVQYASILDHIAMTSSMVDRFENYDVEAQAHCKKVRCRDSSPEDLGITFREVSDHCPVVADMR